MPTITVGSPFSSRAATVGYPSQRPNILAFVLDDVGIDVLPAWKADSPLSGSFNAHPITTNIDALCGAANGLRIRNLTVNPSCSPTRVQYCVGRYPFRTGIGGVITEVQGGEVSPSEKMIQSLLVSSGYDSAYCGKWHMSQPTITQLPATSGPGTGWAHPTAMGWRIFRGTFSNLDRPPYPSASGGYGPGYYNFFYHDSLAGNSTTQQQVVGTYATIHTRTTAQDTIIAHLREPWICIVCFNAPHAPWGRDTNNGTFSGSMPPESITHSAPGTYNPDPSNPARAGWDTYRAALEGIDHQIGVLLTGIEAARPGIVARTDTYVFGENGTPKTIWESAVNLGVPNLGTIPTLVTQDRFKGTVYEAGIRVPFVVRGPTVRAGPRTGRRLMDATDIFETWRQTGFGDRNGVVPSSRAIDGKSIAPLMWSGSAVSAWARTFTLAERFTPNGLPANPNDTDRSYRFVASDGSVYSLVQRTGQTDEFYRLRDASFADVDPWQQSNLGTGHARYPEAVAALAAKLAEAG